MPFGNAQYGASITGFTNTNPCVISIVPLPPTAFINIGDQIIIANVVCENNPQINGKYLISDLSHSSITINLDATSIGSYVSGGFATVEKSVNPNPSAQLNFYQQFVPYISTNIVRGT